MSSSSGADTAVRGVVMLAVLGGGVWGALQYPPVRDRANELLARWEAGTLLHAHDEVGQARQAGGDAPPFVAAPDAARPPAPLRIDDLPHPLAPVEPDRLYPAQQVDYRRDADPAPASERALGAPPVSATALAELEAQLSQLGATYSLLERWQNPPRYRFHCRVQLSPGTEPRRFEASGPDPARVVQEVAAAVAACRSERVR